MAKKYSGSSVKRGNLVEMYGVKELLNKLEKAGGNVEEACAIAVNKSLQLVGKDMQDFMTNHVKTGDTVASYEQIMASIKDNLVEAMVGYNVKKGGLPAIFLDVGTPSQKGYFYRYYAVENNQDKIHDLQVEALNEILKELK